MKSAFLLFTLLFAVILGGCDSADQAPAKKKLNNHYVEVFPAQIEKSELNRIQTGTLKAKQTIQVYNQIEGQLIALPYFASDQINKGDLLAQIEDNKLQAQYQKAVAVRKKAEKDLQRVSSLIKRKLVAQTELTARETDLAIARADEQLISTQLGYTKIFAPISGVITERLTEPGNIVEDYTHLLSIADLSELQIEVAVSELFINKLNLKMPVQIHIDALTDNAPGDSFSNTGYISRIHPTINPNSRMGKIDITLSPVPTGAKPGQFARIRFEVPGSQNLSIPYASLRRDETQNYVYVVNDQGTVEKRTVTLGLQRDKNVEVLSGLSLNDQVITRGFTNLKEGMSVKIAKVAE